MQRQEELRRRALQNFPRNIQGKRGCLQTQKRTAKCVFRQFETCVIYKQRIEAQSEAKFFRYD